MHCASCDLLVREKFEELKNVTSVQADHVTQQVVIEHEGELDTAQLQKQIGSYGYKVLDLETAAKLKVPLVQRILEAVVLAMILSIAFILAGELKLLPNMNITTLSLGSAFALGLAASVSTCMATTGGLYLTTIGKLHAAADGWRTRMAPAAAFNAGRVLMYAVMGMINGYVGQFIARDMNMGLSLNVVVGILLIFVGLDMLRILPLNALLPGSWLKNFFLAVERRLVKNPRRTALLLGAVTYWLPCGFTQSVQLYALSIADPVQSMLIMTIFALGTTPAMLAVGFATSVMRSAWYGWFMKIIAVLITLVGISYIVNFLSLYGLNPLDRFTKGRVESAGGVLGAAGVERDADGAQIIRMTVTNSGYTPNAFTVQKGIPVKWLIEGKEVYGCQAYLVAPKINLETVLREGSNTIEFIPAEAGEIGFSCSMGMYGGTIRVVEG